jgi:hypothetical protein
MRGGRRERARNKGKQEQNKRKEKNSAREVIKLDGK